MTFGYRNTHAGGLKINAARRLDHRQNPAVHVKPIGCQARFTVARSALITARFLAETGSGLVQPDNKPFHPIQISET